MGQKFPRGYLKELVVSEAGPPDVCWLWPGYVDRGGYGVVSADGKTQFAHRVAYAHRHGSIPDGLVIDHLCRQRSCFNPAHLEAVTHTVNMQRAIYIPRGPNTCPQGYLQSLVISEAGPPGECWIWPGHIDHRGYGTVRIGGRQEKAHRAAYAAHFGKIAEGLVIDHRCHQRACFNHRHLRAVSPADNMRNMQRYSNNTSGYPGVHWRATSRKWLVYVKVNGKQQHLGCYRTKGEAVKIAKEARRQLGFIH